MHEEGEYEDSYGDEDDAGYEPVGEYGFLEIEKKEPEKRKEYDFDSYDLEEILDNASKSNRFGSGEKETPDPDDF
jgi:hypothetical protein